MKQKNTIKVIIPVRGGSQRVKNKNIRPFADSNLLEIKIKQMKRIEGLDGIIVNSDSDEMLNIAKNLGVETVKRDSYFASSTVLANELYKNLAQNCDSDIILLANVTNPLLSDNTIRTCIDTYFQNLDKYDSLTTVHEIKEFLCQDGKPLNYDKYKRPRSQDLPDIVALNHALYIIPRDLIIEKSVITADKPLFYKINPTEAFDIDTEMDFELAEFMYRKLKESKSNE